MSVGHAGPPDSYFGTGVLAIHMILSHPSTAVSLLVWYHISLVCKSRPALFYDKCGPLFRLATYCTQTKTTLFMLKSLFSQALGSHCRSVYIYIVATLCSTVHNHCVQNNVGIWLYLVNYATKLKFFSS